MAWATPSSALERVVWWARLRTSGTALAMATARAAFSSMGMSLIWSPMAATRERGMPRWAARWAMPLHFVASLSKHSRMTMELGGAAG